MSAIRPLTSDGISSGVPTPQLTSGAVASARVAPISGADVTMMPCERLALDGCDDVRGGALPRGIQGLAHREVDVGGDADDAEAIVRRGDDAADVRAVAVIIHRRRALVEGVVAAGVGPFQVGMGEVDTGVED